MNEIDQKIKRIENQINTTTRRIEQYQLARRIFELILRELKGQRIVEEAERIVKGCNIDNS